MSNNNHEEDLLNDVEQKSLIYKYLINYSIQLILNKYHLNLSQFDKNLITKDYKSYLDELNSFIYKISIRINLSLLDFQKLIILINKFFKIIELNNLNLNLNFKQVILAILTKLRPYENWELISNFSSIQLNLLINQFDYFFNINNENLIKINNQDLYKLNSLMKNLIYSNFEIIA